MLDKVKWFTPSFTVPDFYIYNQKWQFGNAFQVIEDLTAFAYYGF